MPTAKSITLDDLDLDGTPTPASIPIQPTPRPRPWPWKPEFLTLQVVRTNCANCGETYETPVRPILIHLTHIHTQTSMWEVDLEKVADKIPEHRIQALPRKIHYIESKSDYCSRCFTKIQTNIGDTTHAHTPNLER